MIKISVFGIISYPMLFISSKNSKPSKDKVIAFRKSAANIKQLYVNYAVHKLKQRLLVKQVVSWSLNRSSETTTNEA